MSTLCSNTSSKMYNWRVKSIYQALSRADKAQGVLEVSDLLQLGHLDQYHHLGVSACDEGIDILSLTENAHVLDVGSGVGGVGLSNKIDYITGDILEIDLEENYFDHFVS